jgi:flagellar motor switch/type III secretory pathway protein FliN
MTVKARAWLPPEAISSKRLEPILNHMLGEWSRHWFAGASASAVAAFQDDWPRGKDELGWRSFPQIASLACTLNAKCLVAGAMLGASVPQATLQPGDREVVEDLASSCLDDLLKRVGQLARGRSDGELGDEPIAIEDCHWWDISLGSRRGALKLAISASAIVAIVKRGFSAPPAPRLGRLGEGLGGQNIDLAADLGRCRISLAELQSLGAGDVLILDRLAEEPVDLLVNGRAVPLKASLEGGDQAVLVLAGAGKK